MQGIWKMLTGKGEAAYQAQHKAFRDAIPDSYPDGMSIEERAANHPAYSGPLANTSDAANYRRAHYMHGPQSKAEHAAFARHQAMMAGYEHQKAVKPRRVSLVERLTGLL